MLPVDLRPLRVPKSVDVFGLPTPLGAVAQDCVALNPSVRSPLSLERRPRGRFRPGKLSTQLFEALISAAVQGPDTFPVKRHSDHVSEVKEHTAYRWSIQRPGAARRGAKSRTLPDSRSMCGGIRLPRRRRYRRSGRCVPFTLRRPFQRTASWKECRQNEGRVSSAHNVGGSGSCGAAGGQAPGGGDRVVASGDTERLAVPVVRQLEWLTTGDSLETATTVPALGPQGVSKSDPL